MCLLEFNGYHTPLPAEQITRHETLASRGYP